MKSINEIAKEVAEVISSKYGVERIHVGTQKKNNGLILTGITIFGDSNASPVVYINEFVKDGMDVSEMADTVYELYQTHKKTADGFKNIGGDLSNYEFCKNKLGIKIVNAERNASLLNEAPHKLVEDLAVLYQIIFEEDGVGLSTILIKNEMLIIWGIEQDQLDKDAMENSLKIQGFKLQPMSEVMREIITGEHDIDVDPLEVMQMIEDIEEDGENMFVLSNTSKINGAVAFLYDGVLEKFAEKFKSDLFVIPSSVHELLIMPANFGSNAEALREMVIEVNATQLEPEDFLSDNVYFYNLKEKKFAIA